MKVKVILGVLGFAGLSLSTPTKHGAEHVVFKGPHEVTPDSIHNIHIEYTSHDFNGDVQMVYGSCDNDSTTQKDHNIGRTQVDLTSRPTRFVWIVPQEIIGGGCLHAFSASKLVGRSKPISVGRPTSKREAIADVADWTGPWFDGVAYMKSKNNTGAFVAAAKSKS